MKVGDLVMAHSPEWAKPKLGIVTNVWDGWLDVFVFASLPTTYRCADSELASAYWCAPLEVSR